MQSIRDLVEWLRQSGCQPGRAAQRLRGSDRVPVGVYPRSVADSGAATFLLARVGNVKQLVCWGDTRAAAEFDGETDGATGVTVMPCNLANVAPLHATFPFTKPVPVARQRTTFGTGDRLGLAAPGHIRAIRPFDAVPVLAQQSQRELSLTGRTFPEVIAAASWGAFQEHFTRGYGADADHLKSEDEVRLALQHGATMITLDCSEHIGNTVATLSEQQALAAIRALPASDLTTFEQRYLGQDHVVRAADGLMHTIRFTPHRLALAVLVYGKAIEFTRRIYEQCSATRACDFEPSIDETLTPTDPAAHFFVANELHAAGVRVMSIAPRFSGEFQKGIDYIGDRAEFEREFAVHAAIADHFGHKLSIHSGSDKFAVFPIIGRCTGGRLHHKTAGTSWLEALRLVAAADAALFREMHAYARASFPTALRYYHVRLKADELPNLEGVSDEQLPNVLDEPAHRQLLHITYGAILTAEQEGRIRYKPRLLELLARREEAHYAGLERHIGRHLRELGIASQRDVEGLE